MEVWGLAVPVNAQLTDLSATKIVLLRLCGDVCSEIEEEVARLGKIRYSLLLTILI